MAFNTVADADAALGYLDAWTARGADDKLRVLDTAYLWLTANYTLPLALTAAELIAVKGAELAAVRYHLVEPLFGSPGTASKGAILREKVKVEGLEEEFQYADPTTVKTGAATVPEVDAWLAGIAVRRDAAAHLPAVFVA